MTMAKSDSKAPSAEGAGPTDDEILDLVEAGHLHAFDLIVTRHGGRVRRYVRQTVGSDPALDDLTQEVFVRIFRGVDKRRRVGAFPVWLYRVARSVAVDHVRRSQAYRRIRAGAQERLESAGNEVATPLECAEVREFEQQFREALEEVPEEFRTPFLLREQEDMSYEQIAEVLDCPVKTVSTRIFRARRRLRGLLAPFLPALTRQEGS